MLGAGQGGIERFLGGGGEGHLKIWNRHLAKKTVPVPQKWSSPKGQVQYIRVKDMAKSFRWGREVDDYTRNWTAEPKWGEGLPFFLERFFLGGLLFIVGNQNGCTPPLCPATAAQAPEKTARRNARRAV